MLKRDDAVGAHGKGLPDPAERRGGGVARLAGWLRRALGRECASGVWTISPDGKLDCESWRAGPGRPD